MAAALELSGALAARELEWAPEALAAGAAREEEQVLEALAVQAAPLS
jgi:hypothetical protein